MRAFFPISIEISLVRQEALEPPNSKRLQDFGNIIFERKYYFDKYLLYFEGALKVITWRITSQLQPQVVYLFSCQHPPLFVVLECLEVHHSTQGVHRLFLKWLHSGL